jgi:hypothetical protein
MAKRFIVPASKKSPVARTAKLNFVKNKIIRIRKIASARKCRQVPIISVNRIVPQQ